MARSYGYTVARVKALENKLLDESFMLRLTESATLESALKSLGETLYGPALMELKSPLEFDKAIDAELARTYRELLTFVPQADLVALARLLYDFHNAKVVLKGKQLASAGGSRRLDLLTPLANVDPEAMTLALEGDDFSSLPYQLGDTFKNAYAAHEGLEHSRTLERELDKGYYRTLVKLAEELNVPEVTEWVKNRIDGDNLRSLLRLSRLGLEPAESREYLVEGGNLDLTFLRSLTTEPVENWSRLLGTTCWAPLFAPFAENSDFATSLARFERDLDDHISASLAGSKFSTFSPANVIRYLWAKEMEVKNLRLTLVSIANGVPRDQIRGVLRHVG